MSHRFLPMCLAGVCVAVFQYGLSAPASAENFELQLRSQKTSATDSQQYERTSSNDMWKPEETAVIVCDVWDKHHCLNAVRRMEEFVPRMNEVLKAARQRGATIIHSPSDCMPAYEDHAARKRAIASPTAASKPTDVEFWCSKIPAEEQAVYPIDQSDGGEDDDPAEHVRWAAELKALGRNPGLPWARQSDLVEIDAEQDFISDRGDEVWNILEARNIRNVILVGVHTNMCVLGRPFGLRQMVRNGKNVVLMRDMTDCMYNPARWPYVDHFTGNDLIISHVERFVCPTVTSDQILGGKPFQSAYDKRTKRDVMSVDVPQLEATLLAKQWTTAATTSSWKDITGGGVSELKGTIWYRCSVRLPSSALSAGNLTLDLPSEAPATQAWLNGQPLKASDDGMQLLIPVDAVAADDINLLVVRVHQKTAVTHPSTCSGIHGQGWSLDLNGHWQIRVGDDSSWSNIPLPAKFGLGSDVLFELK